MRAEVLDCFNTIDVHRNGHITILDISVMLKNLGHPAVSDREMKIVLSDVVGSSATDSDQVSLPEFEKWYERSLFWTAHKERASTEQGASEGAYVYMLFFSFEISLHQTFFYGIKRNFK